LRDGSARSGIVGQTAEQDSGANEQEGTVSVALLAMFFTGMALGGFVVGYRHRPAQFAANTAAPPIFYNGGAAPVLQR
jgi:hypothetical protein